MPGYSLIKFCKRLNIPRQNVRALLRAAVKNISELTGRRSGFTSTRQRHIDEMEGLTKGTMSR
jgi:hypothetical protein